MISVVIPVYNQDIRDLVRVLDHQLNKLETTYEILLIDDFSTREYRKKNRQWKQRNNIRYIELEENIGRSAIRNMLAKTAKYGHLLFLDGDSQVVYPDFCKTYIELLSEDAVVCGGRSYPSAAPKDQNYLLHYTYGRQRECPSAHRRNQFPARYFHSNNFLISKELFDQHKFPELREGHGYEDLLFASALADSGISIMHIENRVLHADLTDNATFLGKIHQANQNLMQLYRKGIKVDSRLLHCYHFLQKYRLTTAVKAILFPMQAFMLKSLNSTRPRLSYLDFYKLYHLLQGQ